MHSLSVSTLDVQNTFLTTVTLFSFSISVLVTELTLKLEH